MSENYFWVANYEEGVPANVEIPNIPLAQVLTNSAREYADQVAVRMVLKYLPLGLSIQSKLTYRALHEASNRFAAVLHDLGVRPGDRVSLMLPNIPQSVVAFWGILRAGGIVVNTNPTYTPRELQHQLADSGAETFVTISGLYDRLETIRADTSVKNVILTEVSSSLGWPFKSLVNRQLRASGAMKEIDPAPGLHWYAELMNAAGAPPQVQTAADDVVLFQYTGGTTGRAKAAMLTNANLVSNIVQCAAWFCTAERGREKMLGTLPFFHVYGMTVAELLGIYLGAEIVIAPDPRNTEHVLQLIHRERVSLFPGVPAMYVAIINHPNVHDYNLRSVKACLSGGAALPVEVAQQFQALTGGRLVEGYGLTECAPVACANPLFGEARVGSAGLPISNTRVEIVALEPDEEGHYPTLRQGEEGEIVIYGPQVMKGYWNQPEETAETINAAGGLHTGDIGRMDEDGYVYIVDRKKDLIIASGYNIVPREVEEVLFMHNKIREAVVAGIPDPKRGETAKAYVVLKESVLDELDALDEAEQEQVKESIRTEIRAFCKENLAPYKVPKLFEFRRELPKSQVGKVLRRVLVEEEKQRTQEPETVAS